MITSVEEWPSGPVLLTWVPHPLPYKEPVTSVHCFCFHNEAVILVDVAGRGLGIPGGHVEESESTMECLEREMIEEASVTIDAPILLGAIQVDHQGESGRSKYPANASLLVYACRAKEVRPFQPLRETSSRVFIPPREVSGRHEGWNDVLQAALEAAVLKAGQ